MRTAQLNRPADKIAGLPVCEPLLTAIDEAVGVIAAHAAARDADGAFPAAEIGALHGAGLLAAPMPVAEGGLGWGCTPDGALALLGVLRRIGAASLAVGRLYEAHVNALALVAAYGTPAQAQAVSHGAASGHLFGLWVTDGAQALRLENGSLQGGKAICSGAGHISRALVTALLPGGGTHMALVALPPARRVAPAAIRLTGMRAAVTGAIDFTGLPADPLGRPGDYLREPIFSAGAWRTAAVTLGGLDALVRHVGQELTARGRDANPHQRARFGRLLIAQESAALWLSRAAPIAETRAGPAQATTGYVNLARLAIESLCLEAVALAQRCLGLNAFIAGHPVERIMRDLATYLRQPAPDEALCEAAAWFIANPLPEAPVPGAFMPGTHIPGAHIPAAPYNPAAP